MTSKELQAELTCPICMELFRQPRRLPCGHSYCHICIKAMIDTKAEESGLYSNYSRPLVCPECRDEISVDFVSGIEALPPDFKLTKLVELFQFMKTESDSDEDVRAFQSVPCQLNPNPDNRSSPSRHSDTPLSLPATPTSAEPGLVRAANLQAEGASNIINDNASTSNDEGRTQAVEFGERRTVVSGETLGHVSQSEHVSEDRNVAGNGELHSTEAVTRNIQDSGDSSAVIQERNLLGPGSRRNSGDSRPYRADQRTLERSNSLRLRGQKAYIGVISRAQSSPVIHERRSCERDSLSSDDKGSTDHSECELGAVGGVRDSTQRRNNQGSRLSSKIQHPQDSQRDIQCWPVQRDENVRPASASQKVCSESTNLNTSSRISKPTPATTQYTTESLFTRHSIGSLSSRLSASLPTVSQQIPTERPDYACSDTSSVLERCISRAHSVPVETERRSEERQEALALDALNTGSESSQPSKQKQYPLPKAKQRRKKRKGFFFSGSSSTDSSDESSSSSDDRRKLPANPSNSGGRKKRWLMTRFFKSMILSDSSSSYSDDDDDDYRNDSDRNDCRNNKPLNSNQRANSAVGAREVRGDCERERTENNESTEAELDTTRASSFNQTSQLPQQNLTNQNSSGASASVQTISGACNPNANTVVTQQSREAVEKSTGLQQTSRQTSVSSETQVKAVLDPSERTGRLSEIVEITESSRKGEESERNTSKQKAENISEKREITSDEQVGDVAHLSVTNVIRPTGFGFSDLSNLQDNTGLSETNIHLSPSSPSGGVGHTLYDNVNERCVSPNTADYTHYENVRHSSSDGSVLVRDPYFDPCNELSSDVFNSETYTGVGRTHYDNVEDTELVFSRPVSEIHRNFTEIENLKTGFEHLERRETGAGVSSPNISLTNDHRRLENTSSLDLNEAGPRGPGDRCSSEPHLLHLHIAETNNFIPEEPALLDGNSGFDNSYCGLPSPYDNLNNSEQNREIGGSDCLPLTPANDSSQHRNEISLIDSLSLSETNTSDKNLDSDLRYNQYLANIEAIRNKPLSTEGVNNNNTDRNRRESGPKITNIETGPNARVEGNTGLPVVEGTAHKGNNDITAKSQPSARALDKSSSADSDKSLSFVENFFAADTMAAVPNHNKIEQSGACGGSENAGIDPQQNAMNNSGDPTGTASKRYSLSSSTLGNPTMTSTSEQNTGQSEYATNVVPSSSEVRTSSQSQTSNSSQGCQLSSSNPSEHEAAGSGASASKTGNSKYPKGAGAELDANANEYEDDDDDGSHSETSMLQNKKKPRSKLRKFITSLLSLSSSSDDEDDYREHQTSSSKSSDW